MLTSIDFAITFDVSSRKLILKDTTDYTGQLVDPAECNGIFKIENDYGIVYNNTVFNASDIQPSISKVFEIAIPLSALKEMQMGSYRLVYKVEHVHGPSSVSIEEKKEVYFSYTPKAIDLVHTVDTYKPIFISVDRSDYALAGVEPTIVRDFRIIYPAVVAKQDVVSTQNTVFTNTFYHQGLTPLQHQVKLNVKLKYLMQGYNIIADITKVDNVNVINAVDIASVYDCIHNLYLKWQEYHAHDRELCDKYHNNWQECMHLLSAIDSALKVQAYNDIQEYIRQILKIGECKVCKDDVRYDVPKKVVGVSGDLEEFNAMMLQNLQGQDGVGIADVKLTGAGHVEIILTDGKFIDVGRVVPDNGISVTNASIFNGKLKITLSDGNVIEAGEVVPPEIVSADISTGNLVFTLNDGKQIDAGALPKQNLIPDSFTGKTSVLYNDGANNLSWQYMPDINGIPIIHSPIDYSGNGGLSLMQALSSNTSDLKTGDFRAVQGGKFKGLYQMHGYNDWKRKSIKELFGNMVVGASNGVTLNSAVKFVGGSGLTWGWESLKFRVNLLVDFNEMNNSKDYKLLDYSNLCPLPALGDQDFINVINYNNNRYNVLLEVNSGQHTVSIQPFERDPNVMAQLRSTTWHLNLNIEILLKTR